MTIKEMNSPLDIGIARIISKKGLKQVYLAKQIGYTARELSDMLNGRKLIKICDILKFAEALGVTLNDIYAVGKERKNERAR